jgi:hypothetical protein
MGDWGSAGTFHPLAKSKMTMNARKRMAFDRTLG